MNLKLDEKVRAETLEWCRAFIDHNCIFRTPGAVTPQLLHPDGRTNTWQFYLQVATLDQGFCARIGLLFWDRFNSAPAGERFQICGCETGGVPLACALQASAYSSGFRVNVFSIKKAPKKYGLKNWLEGRAFEDSPVMLVDDVIGGGDTLQAQAKRLVEFGFTLYPQAFAIASCKHDKIASIKLGNQIVEPVFLYGPDDFARSEGKYAARYNRPPRFGGTIV